MSVAMNIKLQCVVMHVVWIKCIYTNRHRTVPNGLYRSPELQLCTGKKWNFDTQSRSTKYHNHRFLSVESIVKIFEYLCRIARDVCTYSKHPKITCFQLLFYTNVTIQERRIPATDALSSIHHRILGQAALDTARKTQFYISGSEQESYC